MAPSAEAYFYRPALADEDSRGVLTLAGDGRLRSINPRARALLGPTPLVGSDVSSGFEPRFYLRGRELPPSQTPFARALREGLVSSTSEAAFARADGTILAVALAVEPVRDLAGRVVGAVAFLQTVEESTAAHANETLPTLISYIGPDLRYRFVNAAYEQWFGRPSADIVGRKVEDVLGTLSYAEVGPYLVRALQGEDVECETSLHFARISRRIRIHYVPDLGPAGVVRGTAAIVNQLWDFESSGSSGKGGSGTSGGVEFRAVAGA